MVSCTYIFRPARNTRHVKLLSAAIVHREPVRRYLLLDSAYFLHFCALYFLPFLLYTAISETLDFLFLSQITSKFSAVTICLIILINALVDIIFCINVIDVKMINQNISLDFILRRYIYSGRYVYLLKSEWNMSVTPSWEETNTGDYILGCMCFFGVCFRQFFAFFNDALMLVLTIVMWSATKGFKNLVRQDIEAWREMVSEQNDRLKFIWYQNKLVTHCCEV